MNSKNTPKTESVINAMQTLETNKEPTSDLLGKEPTKQDFLRNLEKKLNDHIRNLSNIGVRNIENELNYDNLKKAASYIKDELYKMGFENFTVAENKFIAIHNEHSWEVENIEIIIRGTDNRKGAYIIGAHYDTVEGSPGANDNASAVAAILEIARYMKRFEGKAIRTLKLLFFPNEESPYSVNQNTKEHFCYNMGSMHYARQAKQRGDRIKGAIILDTIACFSDQPGSQHFPLGPLWIWKWLGYSDKADFLCFVSNWRSRSLLKKCRTAFNENQKTFPTARFTLPHWRVAKRHYDGIPWWKDLPARLVERSDHASFWYHGFPAILITDTANSRNPHYHMPTDTHNNPESVNYAEITRAVYHLMHMTQELIGLSEKDTVAGNA